MNRIAALFVDSPTIYSEFPGVDVWPKERDARKYDGPLPVVAHPPCERYSLLAHIHKHRFPIGDDDGCFVSALYSVRNYGGVLEHPARSMAWQMFGLRTPVFGEWLYSAEDNSFVTEVWQSSYGHLARKPTWLYVIGCVPPPLDWSKTEAKTTIEMMSSRDPNRSRTPVEFARLLLSISELSSSSAGRMNTVASNTACVSTNAHVDGETRMGPALMPTAPRSDV